MKKQSRPAPMPPLVHVTPDELRLLRSASYEEPGTVRGTREVKMAQRLIDAGLLERDPSAALMRVRHTGLGQEVARPLTRAGVERVVEQIADLKDEDPEAAASLERRLWDRVLVEGADQLSRAEVDQQIGPVAFSEIVKIVLRTAQFEFRRG